MTLIRLEEWCQTVELVRFFLANFSSTSVCLNFRIVSCTKPKRKTIFRWFSLSFSAFHQRCDTKLKVNYFRESWNHEKRREKMLLNNVSLKGFPLISKFNRLPCYLLSRFSSHGAICQFCDGWKIRKIFSAQRNRESFNKVREKGQKLLKIFSHHLATATKQILMKTLRFPSLYFFPE